MKSWIKQNILPIIFAIFSAIIFSSGMALFLSQFDFAEKGTKASNFSLPFCLNFTDANISSYGDNFMSSITDPHSVYLFPDNHLYYDSDASDAPYENNQLPFQYMYGGYSGKYVNRGAWYSEYGNRMQVFSETGELLVTYDELVSYFELTSNEQVWGNSYYVNLTVEWEYAGIFLSIMYDGTEFSQGHPTEWVFMLEDFQTGTWSTWPVNTNSLSAPTKSGKVCMGYALSNGEMVVSFQYIGHDTWGDQLNLNVDAYQYDFIWLDDNGQPVDEYKDYFVFGRSYDVYPVWRDVVALENKGYSPSNIYVFPEDVVLNIQQGEMLPDLDVIPVDDEGYMTFDGYWTDHRYYDADEKDYGYGKQVYDANGKAMCTYEGESIVLYPRWVSGYLTRVTFDANGGEMYRNLVAPKQPHTKYGAATGKEGNTFVFNDNLSGYCYGYYEELAWKTGLLELNTSTDYYFQAYTNLSDFDFENVSLTLIGFGHESNEQYEINIGYHDTNGTLINFTSKYTTDEIICFDKLHYESSRTSGATQVMVEFICHQYEKLTKFSDDGQYFTNGYDVYQYNVFSPTREGYTFLGWQDDKGNFFDVYGDFACITRSTAQGPQSGLYYTAVWEEIAYNLYVCARGGEVVKTYSLKSTDPLPTDVVNDPSLYKLSTGQILTGFKKSGTHEKFYWGYDYNKTNMLSARESFGYSQDVYISPMIVDTWASGFDQMPDFNGNSRTDYADFMIAQGRINYGDGTRNNPYKVSTPEDLGFMSYLSIKGNQFFNQYFIQTDDIDLSETYWYPINLFRGTYDGNGYSISNLNMYDEYYDNADDSYYFFNYGGMFDRSDYGDFYNINIESGHIYACNETGGIVAKFGEDATAINCVNRAEITTRNLGYSMVGGIVGRSDGGAVKNCKNYGNITSYAARQFLGGIVGSFAPPSNANADFLVEGCTNDAEIILDGSAISANIDSYAGGIIGKISFGEGGKVEIKNCINKGDVVFSNYSATQDRVPIGGVVGRIEADAIAQVVISECINSGNVKGCTNVAGIIGKAEKLLTTKIQNCINLGDVTATDNNIGGIVGYLSYGEITSCVNLGNVTGKNYVGGIVGFTQSDTTENNPTKIYGCYVSGNVSATTNDAGGIVGRIDQNGAYTVEIGQSMFNGSVSASSNKGLLVGMVGFVDGGTKSIAKITDCLARSTVSTTTLVANGQYTVISTIYETGSGKGYYDGDFSNWSLINGKPIPNNVMWMGGQGESFTTLSGYIKQTVA